MKAFYNEEPLNHEADNNGTRLFRWNIESFEDQEGVTEWTCDEVRYTGSQDENTIKRAIIRDRLTSMEEFALINKYNMHVQGIRENPQAETKYLEYLNFLNDIDEVILSNFE